MLSYKSNAPSAFKPAAPVEEPNERQWGSGPPRPPPIPMKIGDWYYDEFGVKTREITAA